MKLSPQETPHYHLARRPLYWVNYDWELRLSVEQGAIIYETLLRLLPMGDFDLQSLKKLQGPRCNLAGIGTFKKLKRPNHQ